MLPNPVLTSPLNNPYNPPTTCCLATVHQADVAVVTPVRADTRNIRSIFDQKTMTDKNNDCRSQSVTDGAARGELTVRTSTPLRNPLRTTHCAGTRKSAVQPGHQSTMRCRLLASVKHIDKLAIEWLSSSRASYPSATPGRRLAAHEPRFICAAGNCLESSRHSWSIMVSCAHRNTLSTVLFKLADVIRRERGCCIARSHVSCPSVFFSEDDN